MQDELDPGLEAVFQPEAEGVGAALRGRGLVLGSGGPLLAEELAFGGLERLDQQGAHLRGEPAPDLVVAVVGEVQPEAAAVRLYGLAIFAPVEAAPLPDHALDVGGGAVPGEGQKFGFVVRGGDAGQGPHLRVRDLALFEGGRDEGQGGQTARHADLLAGGPEGDAGAPGEPVGAGAAALPESLFVVDPQHGEEAVGGGVDVGAERGDPVAERVVRDGDRAGAGAAAPIVGGGGGGWGGVGWSGGWLGRGGLGLGGLGLGGPRR